MKGKPETLIQKINRDNIAEFRNLTSLNAGIEETSKPEKLDAVFAESRKKS